MVKDKWNIFVLSGWIILSLIIPVGLIVGPLNVKVKTRKKPAIILIILGFVSVVLWIIHFAGMH